MMKKLRFLIVPLIALHFGVMAQVTVVSTPTLITDTLHYYLNKYYFKTNTTDIKLFPYFKSPAATVATATRVTHMGSRFNNPDTVVVTGLEAWVAKAPATISSKIKVHLFLCNLTSAGTPSLPAIDSIVGEVGFSSVITPTLLGGNFTSTVAGFAGYKMTGDFAVLVRNMSTIEGDTVKVLRTAGKTFTNATAPMSEKCSDGGYSFVRFNGNFYKTTDYNLTAGFGAGTDYEFLVAPRVKYNLYAGQIVPQSIADSVDMCTRTPYTFTNASSPYYLHRQYNLIEFYRKWNLYAAFLANPPGGWTPDSSLTWFFEYDDNAEPARDPRKFLKLTETTITSESDLPGCFSSNSLRARLRKMTPFGAGVTLFYNQDFTICQHYCNGDTVGIRNNGTLADLKVYPNPAVNGKATVSGLTGKTSITVFNMIGQEVQNIVTESQSTIIDLQNQPKGTYIIKIENAFNEGRVVKLVHQN
jgi:hypothetical protein